MQRKIPDYARAGRTARIMNDVREGGSGFGMGMLLGAVLGAAARPTVRREVVIEERPYQQPLSEGFERSRAVEFFRYAFGVVENEIDTDDLFMGVKPMRTNLGERGELVRWITEDRHLCIGYRANFGTVMLRERQVGLRHHVEVLEIESSVGRQLGIREGDSLTYAQARFLLEEVPTQQAPAWVVRSRFVWTF